MRRVGYTDCGLTELLAGAGLPKGSFYNYFASKEQFAVEVLDVYFGWHDRLLEQLAADRDASGIERITQYFATLRESAEQSDPEERGCLIAMLSLEKSATSAPLRQALEGVFARWQGRLAAILRQASAKGELADDEDVERLAALLLHTWEGALLRARLERETWPLDDYLATALPRLLRP